MVKPIDTRAFLPPYRILFRSDITIFSRALANLCRLGSVTISFPDGNHISIGGKKYRDGTGIAWRASNLKIKEIILKPGISKEEISGIFHALLEGKKPKPPERPPEPRPEPKVPLPIPKITNTTELFRLAESAIEEGNVSMEFSCCRQILELIVTNLRAQESPFSVLLLTLLLQTVGKEKDESRREEIINEIINSVAQFKKTLRFILDRSLPTMSMDANLRTGIENTIKSALGLPLKEKLE